MNLRDRFFRWTVEIRALVQRFVCSAFVTETSRARAGRREAYSIRLGCGLPLVKESLGRVPDDFPASR